MRLARTFSAIIICSVLAGCQKSALADQTNVEGPGSFTATQAAPHGAEVQSALDGIRSAARSGDTDRLLHWLDPTATFSFGVEQGKDAFEEIWKDDGDKPFERFLAVFDETVAPGGVWLTKSKIRFPYHTRIQADDADPYFVMFVAEGQLRGAPRPDAMPIEIAARDTVLCVDPMCLSADADGWLEVRLADGTTAYAPHGALHPVVSEHRLVLERQDGRYRVLVFVAGD